MHSIIKFIKYAIVILMVLFLIGLWTILDDQSKGLLIFGFILSFFGVILCSPSSGTNPLIGLAIMAFGGWIAFSTIGSAFKNREQKSKPKVEVVQPKLAAINLIDRG